MRLRGFGEWLAIALFRLIIALSKLLPYRPRIAFSSRIIAQIVRLSPRARRRTEANLSRIYPEIAPDERKRFFRLMLRHFSQTIIEFGNIEEFGARRERFHVSGPGSELAHELIANKQAAIMVSGHLGQWECVRALANENDALMAGIYKEYSNVFYQRFFHEMTSKIGPMFQTGTSGLKALVRHLAGGGIVAILHDQRERGAPILDFLGHQAHSSLAAAELALKYKVPLIPSFGVRRENFYDYDVIFDAPIAPSDPQTMTQELNDAIANMVRKYPEQYFWLHQRWKISKASVE